MDIFPSCRFPGGVTNPRHHMPAFAEKGLHMLHRSPPTSTTLGLLATALARAACLPSPCGSGWPKAV